MDVISSKQKEIHSFSSYEMSDIMEWASVILQSAHREKLDYGSGERYTNVEVHTVSYIADHPDSTLTDIARRWGKTKASVSVLLSRLRQMKVIEGTADPKDQKRVLLQLTPKGEELDHFHRLFDEIRWDETRRAMREHFTDEEIDCAFSVLRFWCTYMEDITRNMNADEEVDLSS